MPNVKPVAVSIAEAHDNFTSDPAYTASLAKIDKQALRTATKSLKDDISILVNYHVFVRHQRHVMVLKGRVGDVAQNSLVARGSEALGAYHRIASSLSAISDAAQKAGFDKVVERHIGPLCMNLDKNPKVIVELQEIEEMGITKAEVSCVTEELRKHDFNLLYYGGADGTLAGFVRKFSSLSDAVEKEVNTIEKHGIPAVVGAGGSSGTTGAAVGAAVVAGILCLITVFYA